MGWKETHMNGTDWKESTQPGVCKRCGKKAVVVSVFNGKVENKYDQQRTYDFIGYKCSLQENSYVDPVCINDCPLIQKEWL